MLSARGTSDTNKSHHSVAMVGFDISSLCSICEYRYTTLCNAWRTWVEVGIVGIYRFAMSVRGKSGVTIHDIRIT